MFFMTKSPRKNVPDVGIEFGAACMPSGHDSDRATTPGLNETVYEWNGMSCFWSVKTACYDDY